MEETLDEIDLNFAQLLADIGLVDAAKPETPEERFMIFFTFGLNPKIYDLYHDLRYQLDRYKFMKDENKVIYTKHGVKNSIPGVYELTKQEFAALEIEYYLWATHLRHFHFMGIDGFPKDRICDMQTVVKMILDIPETQVMIQKGQFPQEKELSKKVA